MSDRKASIRQIPRRQLFLGLATGLGLSMAAAQANPLQHAISRVDAFPAIGNTLAARFGNKPEHLSGTTHHVTSCADDGSDGTLRRIIEDPTMMTMSGDSIDFTQLPMMCSKITLAGSSIHVNQDYLYLKGPGAANLTIDADNASRVFYHTSNSGTLNIDGLTIANGQFTGSQQGVSTGGCIRSLGNVSLANSVVTNCSVTSDDVNISARGGGIYTGHDLILFHSTISDNFALTSASSHTYGGGAYVVGSFFSQASTISDNTATAPGSTMTSGGGVLVYGDTVVIDGSTISGNKAKTAGGLMLMNTLTGSIVNSTVSDNTARYYGGILTNGDLTVTSSTIAFNKANFSTAASGIYTRNTKLTLQNSIVADNVSSGEASDLGGAPGTQVDGANNLVVSSTLMFTGTQGVCPRLDPLADNGGVTRTHALRHDSPAIDSGDAGNSTVDQRSMPRPQGAAADIGAFEHQPTDKDESLLASGFDGLCDQ